MLASCTAGLHRTDPNVNSVYTTRLLQIANTQFRRHSYFSTLDIKCKRTDKHDLIITHSLYALHRK